MSASGMFILIRINDPLLRPDGIYNDNTDHRSGYGPVTVCYSDPLTYYHAIDIEELIFSARYRQRTFFKCI